MTRGLPPHLAAIAPAGAHVAAPAGAHVAAPAGADAAARAGAHVAAPAGADGPAPHRLVGTGFRRDFAIPRTIPVMVRDGTTADWADIWPFFRVLLAAGETMCLPNIMMGTDARALWFGGPDTEVMVAVDPRDKPAIDNPDTPILGRVIGTASMRSARDGHGKHVAAARFAVDPRLAGQGVESELGIAILARARRLGFAAVEIDEVVSADSAAMEAWRGLGFDIVGTRPQAFDHPTAGLVGLHTLVRTLREGGGQPADRG